MLRAQVALEHAAGRTDASAADPRSAAAGAQSGTATPSGLAKVGSTPAPGASQAGPAGLLAPEPGVNPSENMERLATVVYAAAGRNQSVARMSLYPPDLGEVTALVRLRQDRMQLRLEVGSEAARDLLTRGLERLREVLQQHGITLDRTTVQVTARNEGAAAREDSAFQGRDGSAREAPFEDGSGRQPREQDAPGSPSVERASAASRRDGEMLDGAMQLSASLNVLA